MSSSTRLGCGRDIDEVWANIDAPPTPHELTCPFCGAARDSLHELERATAALRSADDEDPQLQAGPQVIARILEVARSEARRSRRLPLSKPRPGQVSDELTVSEQAVAAVVRRTGDRHGGLQVRRCSIDLVTAAPAVDGPGPDDEEVPESGVPSDVRVTLRVSVRSDVAIPLLTRELRAAVMEVVDREVGINVVGVDVAVEDVHDA
ncbi:Asp23/Gls24 family envelope stress response protein [Microlunatus antarcticus]|uniref:Asp23 family, cell envelope-related function n=1 Tax=Microlunatus antarcticus TaxID=53388 RepID=A0A7W5JWM1_9ACTN|nr:hypothetical protein [Microlunatus antarcticus]MBB3327431.1 hypothetical protein [Microlunatus antarcticus]